MSTAPAKPRERQRLPLRTTTIVLTEAGYRCAVPTCRGILALDMHHILEVSAGGGDVPENLIALCPTCHALYHRGTIAADAIYAYKAMLVGISRAFDVADIDRLMFLAKCPENFLILSGDGVLHFDRLLAAGLADVAMVANNANQIVTYSVWISDRGRMLVDAWIQGDRAAIAGALSPTPPAD